MKFSSKDFGKTKSTFEVDIPEKLIHKSVASGTADSAFSDERKHPVVLVDLPSKNISLTLGGLEPGQTAGKHRHTYETIIYVLEGEGITTIEDKEVAWKAGDAIYVPQWAWHQHRNLSKENKCTYIACENAPQLQNLGVAIREEAK